MSFIRVADLVGASVLCPPLCISSAPLWECLRNVLSPPMGHKLQCPASAPTPLSAGARLSRVRAHFRGVGLYANAYRRCFTRVHFFGDLLIIRVVASAEPDLGRDVCHWKLIQPNCCTAPVSYIGEVCLATGGGASTPPNRLGPSHDTTQISGRPSTRKTRLSSPLTSTVSSTIAPPSENYGLCPSAKADDDKDLSHHPQGKPGKVLPGRRSNTAWAPPAPVPS